MWSDCTFKKHFKFTPLKIPAAFLTQADPKYMTAQTSTFCSTISSVAGVPGDLIKLPGLTYDHYGVVNRDGQIVSLGTEGLTIWDVFVWDPQNQRVVTLPIGERLSIDTTLHFLDLAAQFPGEWCYRLADLNCEHFARLMVEGVPRCTQRVFITAAAAGTSLLTRPSPEDPPGLTAQNVVHAIATVIAGLGFAACTITPPENIPQSWMAMISDDERVLLAEKRQNLP